MKRLALAAIAFGLLLFAAIANARMTIGVYGPAISGGGGTIPSCSNSLDFSQACNSQYLVLGFP
jgi:hypothetical protein